MEKTCYYTAFDGTRFDNENQCEAYEMIELELRPVYERGDLQCFKLDHNTGICTLLPLSKARENLERFCISTYALIVKTEKALAVWNEISEWYGYHGVPAPDIYIYDSYSYLWVRAKQEIAYWENVKRTLIPPTFKNKTAQDIYNKINAN